MVVIAALIVAAGRGARFDAPLPKQYHNIQGHSALWHSVAAYLTHPAFSENSLHTIRVVINPQDESLYQIAIAGLDRRIGKTVTGGESRQESVWCGLEALANEANPPTHVIIHDAARPLIDHDTISRVLVALEKQNAAIAAIPLQDTLKRVEQIAEEKTLLVQETIERSGLWCAQTPQGFDFVTILNAHRMARSQNAAHLYTDDAAVAENAGVPITLVEGNADNLKITTQADLERARRLFIPTIENLIQKSPAANFHSFRVGKGFDVHRLGAGEMMWLCGVRIVGAGSLIGHSDADVGLHAATDAIFGALAEGDIGLHFSDSDPRWKGAASDQFLMHARDLVTIRGGQISNIDITLICEAPRIGPYRVDMIARIAEILQLPQNRVSVKATTTEKLGFTGRKEGIAAEAIVCLTFPIENSS